MLINWLLVPVNSLCLIVSNGHVVVTADKSAIADQAFFCSTGKQVYEAYCI